MSGRQLVILKQRDYGHLHRLYWGEVDCITVDISINNCSDILNDINISIVIMRFY